MVVAYKTGGRSWRSRLPLGNLPTVAVSGTGGGRRGRSFVGQERQAMEVPASLQEGPTTEAHRNRLSKARGGAERRQLSQPWSNGHLLPARKGTSSGPLQVSCRQVPFDRQAMA